MLISSTYVDEFLLLLLLLGTAINGYWLYRAVKLIERAKEKDRKP